MSLKYMDVPGIGTVRLYKRRDSRALKISIDHNNLVRVSMPSWLPYRSAVEFIKSKKSWIDQHQQPRTLLKTGDAIGKAHRIEFTAVSSAVSPGSRVINQTVYVRLPQDMLSSHPEAQTAARHGAVVALRKEAKSLLPIRLHQLADQYDFNYQSVRIKQLRSRWGSCSQKQHITLNLFLMQLPWSLIDYVILHELTHTKHLHHGADFWAALEANLPSAKALRKQLHAYQPQL